MVQFIKEVPEYQSFASILPPAPIDILQKINTSVKAMQVESEFHNMTL